MMAAGQGKGSGKWGIAYFWKQVGSSSKSNCPNAAAVYGDI